MVLNTLKRYYVERFISVYLFTCIIANSLFRVYNGHMSLRVIPWLALRQPFMAALRRRPYAIAFFFHLALVAETFIISHYY